MVDDGGAPVSALASDAYSVHSWMSFVKIPYPMAAQWALLRHNERHSR